MTTTGPSLPEDVAAALVAGRRIEAIKLLREAQGLSLEDAKVLIDGAAVAQGAGRPGELPGDVIDALRAGRRIEAIRHLRAATGMGLKDAKDAVDASGIEKDPIYAAQFKGDPGAPRGVLIVLAAAVAFGLWWFFA